MRKINFSAGPSTLPLELLEYAKNELCDYQHDYYCAPSFNHHAL